MDDRILRIGNAGGYWGDDVQAIRRQLLGGPPPLDAISIDFLAEVTMSIMQKQRARDPAAGYARDFLAETIPLLPEIARRGTTIITNAGGVNPQECARLLAAAASQNGLSIPIAVVDGDDLMGRLSELSACEGSLACMDTGEDFGTIKDRVASANAYFGALPVARALAEGAKIVITGRVTDTGITLAPMMNAFGWSATDHHRLAAGIVAGHIIECGAQCTGGNLTDWDRVPDLPHIGYPIVEAHSDGSFVLTKHPGTGGRVSIETLREQLVYEMGDPGAYLTPDVVADFTSIQMTPDGADRVRVFGIRGGPPTQYLKVSMSYHAGYKASGALIISGPRALEKARAFAALFWERLGFTPEDHLTEMVGHDSCHGPVTFAGTHRTRPDPSEILLRLSIRDKDKARLEAFARLVPAVILAGPPGVSVLGGKPSVSETIAYWPTLIPRHLVVPRVTILGGAEPRRMEVPFDVPCAPLDTWKKPGPRQVARKARRPAATPPEGKGTRVGLARIAYARSGDKGDTSNIGLIARDARAYEVLRSTVTAQAVKDWFGPMVKGPVTRYEVPNLHALNFLMEEALGGGGTLSLRVDPQGKTLSHALLRMEVPAPTAAARAMMHKRKTAKTVRPSRRTGVRVRTGANASTGGKPAKRRGRTISGRPGAGNRHR